MQQITTRLPGPWVWRPRRFFKSEYDLFAGDGRVAEFVLHGTFRTIATARSEDGCWDFVSKGFTGKRTLIQPCGSQDVVGTYYSHAWRSGGQIELRGGARFVVTSRAFSAKIEVRPGEDAPPLITFANQGFLRSRTLVEIHPSASSQPELPLLVLFGYYIVVSMRRAAVVAAAA